MAISAPEGPRLLVVTNMWPLAGDPAFGVFVSEQVDALRRQGWLVDVYFIHGRERTLNYGRAVVRLRRLLAAQAYGLVHAHYVLSAIAVQLALVGRSRPPFVVTHHGVEVFAGWQAWLAELVSRRAARTIVISQPMATRLGSSIGASRPVTIIPCGVDLGAFQPGERSAARRALGLPSAAPLIAWVGADRPEKRLALAREAIQELRRRGPIRDAVIPSAEQAPATGPHHGPDFSAAELLVVSGIPHREVPVYLQAADALLVTSSVEGGPLVVKEALACNRPVVSTDVGDVRQVLAGLPGCAVIPLTEATAASLAAALRRALTTKPGDLRIAALPFDGDLVARRIGALYREVLAERDTP